MTITYDGNYTPAGNLLDLVNRPDTDESWLSTNNKIQKVDVTTRVQIGSDITVGGNCTVAFVVGNTGASAVTWATAAAGTNDLIESSSGYRKQYLTTGSAIIPANRPQQSAGNQLTTNLAIAADFNTGELNAFNANTYTWSRPTLPILTDQKVTCVLALPNGNWLIGTNKDNVYEIGTSFQVIAAMELATKFDIDTFSYNSLTVPDLFVSGMSFYDNTLLLSDSAGYLWKIYWPTKTVLEVTKATSGTASAGTALSDNASGELPFGPYDNTDFTLTMTTLDFQSAPVGVTDLFLITASNSDTLNFPMLAKKSNKMLIYQGNTTKLLHFFSFTPTAQKTEINSSLLDAGYRNGRVIRILDGGVGNSKIQTDSSVSASSANAFPTSTGQTVIEFAVYGTGVNEKGALSVYTT